MLALTFAGLQWYGPGMAASVQPGAGTVVAAVKGVGRLHDVVLASGTMTLAKATTLKSSPCVVNSIGLIVKALPKGRARMSEVVKIGALSQDDVTGAVWESGAGKVLRDTVALLEKLTRNKFITDPTTGQATLYDNDGVTPLLSGQLYEDATGAQTYRGKGAERRERLT